MLKLTGWHKHTVRGALSRVIKKLEGFELGSEKQDADRRYYLKPTEKKERLKELAPPLRNLVKIPTNAKMHKE